MHTKTATITPERIGRVGQRRQVAILREMLETLELHEGDFVAFTKQQHAKDRAMERGVPNPVFRENHPAGSGVHRLSPPPGRIPRLRLTGFLGAVY